MDATQKWHFAYPCARCGKEHHEFLCRDNEPNGAVALSNVCPRGSTFFQMAEVEVGPEKKVINVFFDSGSDHSYIASDLVDVVRPQYLGKKSLSFAPFGGGRSEEEDRNMYRVKLGGRFVKGRPLLIISFYCSLHVLYFVQRIEIDFTSLLRFIN